MMAELEYIVKYSVLDRIHRFATTKRFTYADLIHIIKDQLNLKDFEFSITYIDDENEAISVNTDKDLEECLYYFTGENDKVYVHLRLVPQKSEWMMDFHLSGAQVRDASIKGYRWIGKILQEATFSAEESFVATTDSAKKIYYKISNNVTGTDHSDTFFRFQAEFIHPRSSLIIKSDASVPYEFYIKNNDSSSWPLDTKLTLNCSCNAVAIVDTEYLLGEVAPNEAIKVHLLLSSKVLSGEFKGYWRLDSENTIFSFSSPMDFILTEPEKQPTVDNDHPLLNNMIEAQSVKEEEEKKENDLNTTPAIPTSDTHVDRNETASTTTTTTIPLGPSSQEEFVELTNAIDNE